MFSMIGYKIYGILFEDSRSVLYRGERDSDNKPVLLKTVQSSYPRSLFEVSIRNEYEITSKLQIEGVPKPYELVRHSHGLVIIMEDKGSKPLRTFLSAKKMGLEDFLQLAISLSDILFELHNNKIIHKDINPNHIFFNPQTKAVELTGFGAASLLSFEETRFLTHGFVEETFAYVSPEQTGRMNRVLDYRTDFYSLGVTFYEILTDQLPFRVNDPLDMVHSHMAREPVRPNQINSSIPGVLSDLVIKLMAKSAEERYQSAAGLKADLNRCLMHFRNKGSVEGFVLGSQDYTENLSIPQKLYGRSKELSVLQQSLEKATAGRMSLIMVSGFAGIGKTSLVRELQSAIAKANGYFITGKFDQLKRNIPYGGIVKALQQLVLELLTHGRARLEQLREEILHAMGSNAQIIVDVIPEIEQLIGGQPPVMMLGPVETQNRFNLVFRNFIQILCHKIKPLVIFLDDLQWVDTATIKLIELMATYNQNQSLLLIGAYRSEEVDSSHPLTICLEKLKKISAPARQIHLNPLNLNDVCQLTSDTLRQSDEKVRLLTESVLQKTYGNPFFVKFFLSSLHQLGLLTFSKNKEKWQWDPVKIDALSVTENVVDLLIKGIQRLEPETRSMMRMAACIGNQFEVRTLAMIAEKEFRTTLHDLLAASEEGLLIPTVGYRDQGTNPTANDPAFSFRFVHDRVQQAAYALIAHEDRKPLHLKIGRLLVKVTSGHDLEDQVFDILNHLNFASDLITDYAEREEMARLNLLAGQRARSAAAFDQALAYLEAGIGFLSENCWTEQYALTLQIYTAAIEAACLSGKFEEMEEIFQIVKENAVSTLDKTGGYETIILGRMLQSKTAESLSAALEILNELSVTLPENFSQDDLRLAMQETWASLSAKSIEDLLSLPEMTDPLQLARLRILVESAAAAYFSRINLLTPIFLKEVELTLRYGHTDYSPYIFCCFGLILCGIAGHIDEGYKSAQIGLSLMERRCNQKGKCRMYHIYNGLVRHYKQHIKASTEMTEEIFQEGLETGDFQYAGWYAYMHCMHLFMGGEKLHTVKHQMAIYHKAIGKIHQQTALGMHEPGYQAVLNLMGDCKLPTILIGEVYDERDRLPNIRKANDRNSILNFYFNKIMLCYLFENYEECLQQAEEAAQYLDGSTALLVVPLFHFYDTLVRLAVCNSCSAPHKHRLMEKVNENLEKIRLWATHAPMNHLHKYYLIEAERLRVAGGDIEEIIKYYDLAIESAKTNGFIHEEALVNKMAAKFWLEKGKKDFASLYMRKAFDRYSVWGAARICRDLEERYGELLSNAPLEVKESEQALKIRDKRALDESTILKAAQAISREIELDQLLKTFMTILLENVGAQKGLLILADEGQLVVEATCNVDEGIILFRPPIPVQLGKFVPSAIVRFVSGTHENVVIDDARHDKRFQKDPYIKSSHPKSLLCAPVLRGVALSGIIYLENNLLSGVFTPERLEVIRVLTSQIAISIENAKLYDRVKKAEEKYRGIFENALEGIYQTTSDGHFISANFAMARMFGFETPKELLGQVTDISYQLYVSPKRREELLDLMQRKETVHGFDVEFFKRDGTRFWAALYARPVFGDDGNLLFVEGMATDITNQRKVMEELQEREEYLRKENIHLRSNIRDRFKFGEIVGKSRAIQEVYELILRAAASDANIVIYGESGTGKELVARQIHNLGKRRRGRFITVNSAAIPSSLLESEFFGYKKGAFTGANVDKQGYLDLADGGTLFLDELGELVPSMQAKLLRAIDGGGYNPVGDTAVKYSNARIIAATNCDLQDDVRRGVIREDFFYRIHVVPIYLPPLRDRKEDIPLLIDHFMNAHGNGQEIKPVPAFLLQRMQDYNWPGNVRELRNAIERFVTMGDLTFLDVHSALKEDEPLFENWPDKAARLREAISYFEKRYLTRLLEQNQWRRGKVADILGVDRRTLFRKIKEYGIKMSD